MTSLVVLFSLSQKVRKMQKFNQRSYTVTLTDLSTAIKNCRKKNSFDKHFNEQTTPLFGFWLSRAQLTKP